MEIKVRTLVFVGITFLVVAGLIVVFSLMGEGQNTGQAIQNPGETSPSGQNSDKYYQINFLDSNNSCALNGKVSLNGYTVGNTYNGSIYLNKSEYDANFIYGASIYLSGNTSSCFGANANLPFMSVWTINSSQDYFNKNNEITLKDSFDPRHPNYLGAVQGFIRPYETLSYYNTHAGKYVNLNKSIISNLNLIVNNFDSNFNYRGNDLTFSDVGYWRTPAEVLKDGWGGDCKNWAVTVLSLINNYNSSLACYNVGWTGHMNVLCHVGNQFVIYDEQGVRSSTTLLPKNETNPQVRLSNQLKIRQMLNGYYTQYGLPPEDQQINYLINKNDIITFNDSNYNQEFVDWALNVS